MKFLISLSLKYLGRQKFRTALTFISIVLAVFIMCFSLDALSTVLVTMKDFEINESGTWEVDLSEFYNETGTLKKAVKKYEDHILTETVLMTSSSTLKCADDDYIELEFGNGRIVNLNSITQKCGYGEKKLDVNVDFHIVKGSRGIYLPTNFKDKGYSVDDVVDLKFTPVLNGKRYESYSEKFTVEGFLSYNYESHAVFETGIKSNLIDEIVKASEDSLAATVDNQLYLRVKPSEDFDKSIEKIINDCGLNIKRVDLQPGNFNGTLLLYELKALIEPMMLIVGAAIIFSFMFLIWLISRMTVDNAMEISVVERTRKFITLKTLGASKKQLTALTVFEALFYNVTAVPIGSGIAYLSAKIIFNMLSEAGVPYIHFSVSKIFIFTGIVLCIISVFISTYTSALWMSRKKTIAEASKYGDIIKRRKKEKRRKTRLNRKCSGFIRMYTKRNISRTKGKYIFSVFACSLSTVILLLYLTIAGIYSQTIPTIDFGFDDYTVYLEGSYTPDEIYDVFRDAGEYCDIDIDAHSGVRGNIDNSKHYFDNYELVSEEETEEYEKLVGEKDINLLLFSVISRRIYERNYLPVTKVSYDELLENRGVFICKSQSGPEVFQSYKSMGYDERPELFHDKFNLYFEGMIMSNSISGNVIIPEELIRDYPCSYCIVILNAKNDNSHDEIKKLISEVKYNNPDIVFISDTYALGTGVEGLMNAVKKIVMLFFFVLWLTGIISMINITTTKIMNLQREYFILRCTGITKKSLTASIMSELVIFSSSSLLLGIFLGTFSGILPGIISSALGANGIDIIPVIVKNVSLMLVLLAANILIPALFSLPLIKRTFSTSSEIVNSNSLR